MPNSQSRALHVLVLSADPVAAAFLGMFVELARYTPAFARAGERPEDAVARVRPLAVVLLDDALDAAQSDLFFAAAARARVGLAIFGAPRSSRALAPQAIARHVPVFDFPATLADLERVLDTARGSQWWGRAAERRRPPIARVEAGAGDSLVYHDGEGCRWNVYDRRGRERRRETAAPGASADPGASVERVFVSETGEVRTCQLAEAESDARHPEELAAQLARAVPAGA